VGEEVRVAIVVVVVATETRANERAND